MRGCREPVGGACRTKGLAKAFAAPPAQQMQDAAISSEILSGKIRESARRADGEMAGVEVANEEPGAGELGV